MAGRRERTARRGRAAVAGRASVTLAVFHASPAVDKHLAQLRRARRFRLACFPQARAPRQAATVAFDGVLWELVPGSRLDRRHLAKIARTTPLVSYSDDGGRETAELSRSLGFASHLRVPLRPLEVEHRLALVGVGDLAERLQRFQSTLRRHVYRVDVLASLVRETHERLEPQHVAEIVAHRAAGWIPAASWAVVLAGPGGSAELVHARGLAPDHEPHVRDIGRQVLRYGREYAARDLQEDERLEAPPAVAAIAFPLKARSATVGALVALDSRRSAHVPLVTDDSRAVLQPMFDTIGLALDTAMRVQRAEELSVTDDLTQLYNSRYLNQALRRETKRATRNGRPLSVLFVDLDGFKSINDAHGHLYGSRALVEAAAVIRQCARETDFVARFGGDEFALVLPDTGSDGARAVGERVRDRIATHRFLVGEGLDLRVSASVGIATLPDAAASAEELLQAADRAMYWVKDHGKNNIRVAAPAALGK
jgi:diguanylate cyclase (GGDEF)-like protein